MGRGAGTNRGSGPVVMSISLAIYISTMGNIESPSWKYYMIPYFVVFNTFYFERHNSALHVYVSES